MSDRHVGPYIPGFVDSDVVFFSSGSKFLRAGWPDMPFAGVGKGIPRAGERPEPVRLPRPCAAA